MCVGTHVNAMYIRAHTQACMHTQVADLSLEEEALGKKLG